MADEERVRTAKRERQEFMKIAMEVQEKEHIKKHEVVTEGRYDKVGGSSSSASAFRETDVVMHAQVKRDRSEDDQTDLTERLNKRTKKMSAAEEIEVAEIIVRWNRGALETRHSGRLTTTVGVRLISSW